MDDSALVAAALAGGPRAFEPIVERYQDAVFGVALARVGNFHDAQDIAQAVLVEAYERLSNLREPDRLGAWLRKMTIHRSQDLWRRRQREMTTLDEIPEPAANATPGNDLREEVLRAISRLSKVQREAVTLFYINGYSVAEVAGMCDVPEGTVKARLHDARSRLKEEMVHVVEDVLKSEAPKDEFARRVYEAVTQSLSWRVLNETVSTIGPRGLDGWLRAMESPNWMHRRVAMQVEHHLHSGENLETILEALKRALKDRNKKIRRSAADAILSIEVDEPRMRREIVPLVVPLLADPSKRVRRMTAFYLLPFADQVPLAPAVEALAVESDPNKRWALVELARRIAASRKT